MKSYTYNITEAALLKAGWSERLAQHLSGWYISYSKSLRCIDDCLLDTDRGAGYVHADVSGPYATEEDARGEI